MLIRPYPEHWAQIWFLLYKKDVDKLEMVQRRATKADPRLGKSDTEERQCEWGLLSHERKRLRGDLSTMSQYLKGGYQGRCSFNKESHGKIMDNGYKLHLGRFQLDTRGKHFTPRTINHWSIPSAK